MIRCIHLTIRNFKLWVFAIFFTTQCTGGKQKSESDSELSLEAVEEGAASSEQKADSQKQKGKNSASGDPFDNDWNNLNVTKNGDKKPENNADKTSDKENKNQLNQKESEDNLGGLQGSNLQTNNQGLSNQMAANQSVSPNGEMTNIPPEEPPIDAEPAPNAIETMTEPNLALQSAPAINAAVTAPEPAPSPNPVSTPAAPALPVAPVESSLTPGGWIIKSPNSPDLEPKMSLLYWVGYDFSEREGLVRIQMVTRGSPKYNVFQERNRADQPELIVRFFNTSLRPKVRRDINASEFRSPVAYIRMRPNVDEAFVDVIMTLRDSIRPRLFNKYGNVMLTFPIPDHYFGTSTVGDAPIAKAEVLPNSHILPDIDQDSLEPESIKVAKAFVPNPGGETFQGVPAGAGETIAPPESPAPPPEVVPVEEIPPPVEAVPASNTISQNEIPPPNNGGLGTNSPDGSSNIPPLDNIPEVPNSQGQAALNENINFSANNSQGQFSNQSNTSQNSNLQQGTGNQGEDQDQGSQLQESQQSEEVEEKLNSDSLENLDDGKGESVNQADKFDVRVSPQDLRRELRPESEDISERRFAFFMVAQDNFASPGGGNLPANGGNGFLNGNAPISNAPQGNLPADGFVQGSTGNTLQTPGNTAGGLSPTNVPTNAEATLPGTTSGNAAGAFPGGSNMAPPPVNGGTIQPTIAPSPNAAPIAEPPIQGQPDLAGQEQVGQNSEEPAVASGGGRPLKLDFRGAPLSEVIRVLSMESGINFILSPRISDTKVFVNLIGVPFNDALRAVLSSNGLGMVEVSPNVIRIEDAAILTTEKENLEKRRKAELSLRPTKILVHRLSYAEAAKAAPLLTQMLTKEGIEPKPSVSTESRTNSVIVNAAASDLATAKALLERIDLETPQVKIASRIVEVLKSASNALGVSWGGPLNFDQGRGLGFGNLVFPNYYVSRYSVDAQGTQDRIGNFEGRIGSLNNMVAFDIALSMEEAKGTSEVIQTSNLIVQDNEKANILDGRSDYFPPPAPVPGVGGGGSAAAERIDYNLVMDVQPHITADGGIQMDISIQSDSPIPSSVPSGRAGRLNRSIKTKMWRRSGETAVIGGVYSSTRSEKKNGIPYLSSIPIIGALFRSTDKTDSKKELLVLVTPTIIAGTRNGEGGNDADPAPATNLSLGSESNNLQGGLSQASNNLGGDQGQAGENSLNQGDDQGSNESANNFQGNNSQANGQQNNQQSSQQTSQQNNGGQVEAQDLGEE